MRIHEQNEVLKNQVKVLSEGLEEIRAYLNSPKFYIDTNVNKNDILLRIQQTKLNFNDIPSIS